MSCCKNCGVELEESMNYCPLCGEQVTDGTAENTEYLHFQKSKPESRLLSDFDKLNQIQRQRLFWELSGIILISGMLVTVIIDLMFNNGITWSKYSLSICLVLFINITLIVFLKKKILLLLIGSFLSTSILLLLFDIFNKNTGWAVNLGIPIILSFYFIVLVLIWLVRRSRQRGINLIAYFLIATGIFCLCIEGIISLQLKNKLDMHWSVIVFASVIPVSAILFYIHYRLKKGASGLNRFFHI